MNYHVNALGASVCVPPRTRSCVILAVWETDRWSSGSDNQPRLTKLTSMGSCFSFSGL